jgi:tetratricopeptide (TPR) repeat protein
MPATSTLPALPTVAYLGIKETEPATSWVEREIVMAAHEGSDHAEHAERRDIGEATLEQIRADVTRLSIESMSAEPFAIFQEMRRVRSRIYAALDRQLWPRDQTELYFLLAVLNCLMAVATDDLGYPQSAQELVRAGWAYATAIDHRPLMAHLRLELAGIAYWHRPLQSRDLAQSGLRYLSDGPNAAQLHLEHGRAAARLGDTATARRAIVSASEAREREHHDELLEIGGEFSFSRATQHYKAGSVLIEIPQAETEAIEELERAIELYSADPASGEHYGYGSVALAHVDLATARLRAGQLDAAIAALEPTLSLSPGQRITSIPQRLSRVRAELAHRIYQGSPQARELDKRIEEFSRETIVADLHDLPASLG